METEHHTAEWPVGHWKIKKFQESNENENTIYQNLWDTTKVVLRGKFVAVMPTLEKAETSKKKQPNYVS
jgi:hypothetical protein